MRNHSPACEHRRETYEAWVAEHPDHCRKCGATGVHMWTENQAPFGSGYSCLEEERCPRCGAEMPVDWHAIDASDGSLFPSTLQPCQACGWSWGHNADDIKPEAECFCLN